MAIDFLNEENDGVLSSILIFGFLSWFIFTLVTLSGFMVEGYPNYQIYSIIFLIIAIVSGEAFYLTYNKGVTNFGEALLDKIGCILLGGIVSASLFIIYYILKQLSLSFEGMISYFFDIVIYLIIFIIIFIIFLVYVYINYRIKKVEEKVK